MSPLFQKRPPPRAGLPLEAVDILGLGSPHGDDQIGWFAAELLAADSALDPARHTVRKLASPWELISFLVPLRYLLVLDGCRSGAQPGSIIEIPAGELALATGIRPSTHGASLYDAVRLATNLGRDIHRVRLIFGEIEECVPLSEMSVCARGAAYQMAAAVRGYLEAGWPSGEEAGRIFPDEPLTSERVRDRVNSEPSP